MKSRHRNAAGLRNKTPPGPPVTLSRADLAVRVAELSEPGLSYRLFYPHQDGPDEISATILARSIAEALELLKTRSLSNLQVMRNGTWTWVV